MPKRKKQPARAAEEAAASPAPPQAAEGAPHPVASPPRRNLPALLIVASLWVGWFVFLVYVAVSRQ